MDRVDEIGPFETLSRRLRSSVPLRVVALTSLALSLQIPIGMINGTIAERRMRRHQVVHDVTATWGKRQVVRGPCVVPYTRRWTETVPDGKTTKTLVREADGRRYVLPETLAVDGRVETAVRRRRIFDIPVYTASLNLRGAMLSTRRALVQTSVARCRMPEFRSQLSVPSHPDSASITGAYVRELVALARLPEEQATHLVLAATESCSGIVRCADAPGDREPLDLIAILTPRSLTLQIHERGAPFDPSDPTGASGPIRGPAWERIRRAVDEARWFNRGSAGMELHLTAHRPDGHVTEHLPESELTAFPHAEPQAPAQAYSIRRFRPADAIGVAQCMYRSFGYTYGDADLYYPDRLVHLNETGQLVSLVAVDEAGAIVGHLGLERPDLGPIAESSDAAVAPAHRHRHLLERLHDLAETEAQAIGLQGLVGYPVTTHPFSQRMDEAAGSHLCGVVLGQLPRSTTFKGITTELTAQRVSTLLYFKYLGTPPPVVVHAPPHHRTMLDRLYANLGVATESGSTAPAIGAGRLVVGLDRSWGFGEIYVEDVGADTAREISRARADLCAVAEVEIVYLYLPLAQAGTPELCAQAETEGFFFSGIGPRFLKDGDALCLQYVGGALDPGLLQIATPFGRELLDYVTAERARVGA